MSIASDKFQAARRAHELLQQEFVVFDTETTGFDSTDEIIQVAAINQDGQTLLHGYIKPVNPIRNSDIHGITDAMVASAPPFESVYEFLAFALNYKNVLVYNYDYDMRMLRQVCDRHSLPQIEPLRGDCVMHLYAAWHGDYNDYRQNYRWQKLQTAVKVLGLEFEGEHHDALTDCRATLAVLRKLSEWFEVQAQKQT